MPSFTTQLPSIRMASHGMCTLLPIRINRSPGTRKRDSSSWTPAESVRKQSWVRFLTQYNIYLNWKSMKKQPKHIWQGSNSTTLTLNLQTIRRKGNKLCYIKWRPLCDNKKISREKTDKFREHVWNLRCRPKINIPNFKRVWEKKRCKANDCIAKLLDMLPYNSHANRHTYIRQGAWCLKRYLFLLIVRKLKNISFLSAFCPSFWPAFISYLPYSVPKPQSYKQLSKIDIMQGAG